MIRGYNLKKAYKKLYIGMPQQTVVNMLGYADSQIANGDIQIFSWWSSEFKGVARGGSMERRITVQFANGQVIGFDAKNIDATIW